jgi:hypothetical protein
MPHQQPDNLHGRDGNEAVGIDFRKTPEHSANTHTGVDKHECCFGFAKGEDKRDEVDSVSDKESKPHTGLDTESAQPFGNAFGIGIEFGEGYGTVRAGAFGLDNGGRIGKPFGNIGESVGDIGQSIA